MPKWTCALFATNQCDQDKRGFNVTDANIGSIGPAIVVLTGTHTGGLKLELDWFCSKCESEVNLIMVFIISNYILYINRVRVSGYDLSWVRLGKHPRREGTSGESRISGTSCPGYDSSNFQKHLHYTKRCDGIQH